MKKFILSLLFAVIATFMFAQTATLRLEMPATPPNPGDDFLVGIWLDALSYPAGVETIKSGQLGINFDPAVLTPLMTVPPPPPPKWYFNLNQMFSDYVATPAAALPFAGDLRFVFYTTFAPGMDPSFYGGIPMKLWDIKFNYVGGPIDIWFGETNTLDKVSESNVGGKLGSIQSYITAWDDAAYAMTYTNVVSATATTWTGAVSNDWANTGNWDSGTVPTATDDVIIPVTANDPFISGAADCNAMQIDPGVMVSVGPAGGALTTHGMLTNDGALFVDGTNAGGVSGSFIDLGGMGGAGTFEMDQDVAGSTAPAADPTGWHYFSSPVNAFNSDQSWDYFINTWDEPTSMWVHHEGSPTIPCDPITPALGMGSLDAWSVKQDIDWGTYGCAGGTGPVIEFMAPTMADVHTGAYGPAAGTFTAGAFAGWNMFGNPYPSSIDPAAITWDPNMNQSVYYWDGLGNTYVSWAGGVGSVIPPAQGFFTSSTAASTMSFAGTERIHGGDWFWKSDIANLLELEVTAANNDYHDVTYVRFSSDATLGFDKVWDAYKLMSYIPGVPQIYTTNGSDELSINAQQVAETVPMNFESVESGTFTIAAIEANDMTTVILEDQFTEEFTDLMVSSYTFDHTVGAPADRFIIHFSPLGVDEMNANSINIWSNESNIYVKAPASANGDIVVYNVMGQEVVRTDIAPGLNTIPMADVNTYYVVKVLTDDNAVTGKVYIK